MVELSEAEFKHLEVLNHCLVIIIALMVTKCPYASHHVHASVVYGFHIFSCQPKGGQVVSALVQ